MSMQLTLGGLHHVSAMTGDAVGNVTFFTQVLGLRLVKKTVNQDDVSSYHLFYGDEVGHPGTEVTFFDVPGAHLQRPGAGTIEAIALSVPDRAALAWWSRRFDELGVRHGEIVERGGRGVLPFTDPEGQRLELVAVDDSDPAGLPGLPWTGSPIPPEQQIRGLHAVRLAMADARATARVLTETLGFRPAPERGYDIPAAGESPAGGVQVFETGPGGSGAELHVAEYPGLPHGRGGIGGVHHIAFRTPDDTQHLAWRERVASAGLNVTPQIDRYYFRSLYFREPGGVLYEIATDGPGFTSDEEPAHLGERLALPPFLEPYRAQIEAGLRPIDIAPAATFS